MKTIGILSAAALVAGLLTAAAAVPVVGMAGVGVGAAAKTFNDLPIDGLGILPSVSKILDSRGNVIADYYPNNVYRVPVNYNQISPVMVNAILSAEDARYYKHGALDPIGTVRALLSSGTQGGSDLAQQYVKNALILTATNQQQVAEATAVTVARKIRELRIAALVAHEMTPNQLIAAYLNAAYFDHQARGIEVAANFYFSTKAKDLTVPQAAMLAGMVENPSKYDPTVFPQNAIGKRNIVIGLMHQYGYISEAQMASAQAAPLGLKISPIPLETGCLSSRTAAVNAAFFCDYVINVLRVDSVYKKAWAELNSVGGMTIQTTMDPFDQTTAQHAVNYVEPSNSNYYNPGHNADTEVLIQPGTGYIRAIAENRVYGDNVRAGQTTVDYAVDQPYGGSAGVQTGSSSKIFTLVTALQAGLPLWFHMKVGQNATLQPYYNCQGGQTQPFQVQNAEGNGGNYTLYTGTTASVNVFYAHLEQHVGLCNVVKTAVNLGMTRADGASLLARDPNLPPDNNLSADNYPSFTLGSIYVSPMSMADAYATLASGGIYCKPIAITAIFDTNGKKLPVESAGCRRAMSADVAAAANFTLHGVLESGTAANRGAGLPPAAAKTGTANGGYYAAFAGYTPLLAAYVSVFNPTNPTTGGRMQVGYGSACYRDLTGLSCPFQMFGDNAPGATWVYTFLHLHLRWVDFAQPSSYWFSGGNYQAPPAPPKKKPNPSPSPTPTPTPSH